ncbi:MAG: isoamylase early set domain-containing protein [Endomicrobiia bacterium]
MKCKNVKLLQKYLENQLSEKEVSTLQHHIKNCPFCKNYLKLEEKLEKLGALPHSEAPEYLISKILSNLPKKEEKFIPNFLPKQAFVFGIILIFMLLWFPLSRKIYQKRVVVRFEIDLPEAQSVAIAGDFNKWDINKTKCKKEKGKWVAEIALKPGRYQYMFVVDKEIWIPDPNATDYTYDSFGKKNSILDTYVCGIRG